MELNYTHRRSRIVEAAVCIIITVLLTSCRMGGPQDPDRIAMRSLLAPHRIDTASGEGALYDLTPLMGEETGVVCACGLEAEYSLLLLTREGPVDMSSGSVFTLRHLDLRDGSLTTSATFPQAAPPRGEAAGGQGTPQSDEKDFEILSADPAVICDRTEGVLYMPSAETKAVFLPEWLRGSAFSCLDGRTYISSDRGIIYTVGEDGSLIAAWKLPCEYGAFTPVVSGHEGKLSFATSTLQSPSDRIFVDVDPRTGESGYYLSDLGPGRFLVYADGRLVGTSFKTAPKVSVVSPASHVRKEMQLPEPVTQLLRGDSANETPAPGTDDTGNARPEEAKGLSNAGFISFSTVPMAVCGDSCMFMLKNEQGYPVRIYLWDTEECAGSNWNEPSVTDYTAPAPVDYGELRSMAQELEDSYGVRIVLGDNIPSEFTDYTAEAVTDPSIIKGSLDVLQNTLSLYPEGFFADLKGNYYREIVLYLTGPLTPLNAGSNISNASAFSTESNGLMQLAFDLYDDPDPPTVIHELTHAMDYRFLGEGLLDEERWNAMNPDGFEYYYAYIDASGESYEISGSADHTAAGGYPADDVYFIEPYSKTYPMEDRALLMENLLAGASPYAYSFSGRHVQEKLSCYFRFIRNTIGNERWPSSTAWEDALREAAVQE